MPQKTQYRNCSRRHAGSCRNLLLGRSYAACDDNPFSFTWKGTQKSLREERFHLDSLSADKIADQSRKPAGAMTWVLFFLSGPAGIHTAHPPRRKDAGQGVVPVTWACFVRRSMPKKKEDRQCVLVQQARYSITSDLCVYPVKQKRPPIQAASFLFLAFRRLLYLDKANRRYLDAVGTYDVHTRHPAAR
jgi:hypothetical protein